MKTQKNIILDSINYLKNFVPTHKEFNTYKHIGRAVSNPLNVSYISAGKIKGIKENTGVTIGNIPTKEQRKKYFVQTSINKLLKKLFVINTSEESKKLETVSQEVDDFLKSSLNYEFKITDKIPQFYNSEKENYNGSCMAGRPSEYFQIYDLINESKKTRVKMVYFQSGEEILARALLWRHQYKVNKVCENTGEILETKIKKFFYLDRIYINSKLQNVCFSELQFKLFKAVRQAYKIELLPCYNKSHIESYILKKYEHTNTEKFKFMCDKATPPFVVSLDFDEVTDLNYFPYLDTFRYIDEDGYLSHDESEAKIIFDQTDGHYTEADTNCCDECGESVHRDDQIYSEITDESLCQDCAIYIDERDEYCNINNATYNSYTGSYHYDGDLDR
jgi:hypothetical protein